MMLHSLTSQWERFAPLPGADYSVTWVPASVPAGIELFYCLCCAPGREGHGSARIRHCWSFALALCPTRSWINHLVLPYLYKGGSEDSVKVLCHFQPNFLVLPPLSWFYLLCENSLHSFLRSALLLVGVVTWNYFELNRFLCTTFSP